MVERWNAARAEAEEEARLDAQESADPSVELLEERKRKRVAEWREQVDEEGNNNFIALKGDWRARIARRKVQKVDGGGGPSRSS